MFDNLRPRSKRKPSEDIPLWSPKETLVEPLRERWPLIRDQVRSTLEIGRDKLAEAYVVVAEVITEKKQAWEDYRAEKRNVRHKAEASGSPKTRRGGSKKHA